MRTTYERIINAKFSKEEINGKTVEIIKPRRASGGWKSCGRQWYVKKDDQVFLIIGYAGRFKIYKFNEEVSKAKASFSSLIGMEQYLIAEFKQLNHAIERIGFMGAV